MTDNLTTALETVREKVERHGAGGPTKAERAALSTIEAELADLKTAFEAECKRAEEHYAWYVKAGAERDEAVAALREVALANPPCFHRDKASIALARLSTPKERTINEKATHARNLMLEGREDEAKDVWSE